MIKKYILAITIIIRLFTTGCKDNGNNDIENISESKKQKTIINEVDYSKHFDNLNGCAIFYNEKINVYDIYNKDMTEEEIPPYSTFKIIASLMGLSKDIVTSVDSKMGYDGTIYWKEQWNNDLGLSDAFRESCVWYFENIVSSLDKEYVQEALNGLDYGNKNISAWDEKGHNTFWISSSLKISPRNQIEVLKKIFEDNNFNEREVEILKEIMLVEKNNEYAIYGKTGSSKNTYGWFVDFVEKNGENTYFAIKLDDEKISMGGARAKEIAFSIIKEHYNK